MPEPIEYLAIKNLQAALLAISVATGSHFTVARGAVKLDPNHDVEKLIAPDGPRPFVILEVQPEAWQYFPAEQLRLTLRVRVHWISESVVTDDNSLLQTYLRGVADIERAIALDPGRGGYVVDTRITRRQLEREVDGGQVWAIVDLELPLHRTYGQPDA